MSDWEVLLLLALALVLFVLSHEGVAALDHLAEKSQSRFLRRLAGLAALVLNVVFFFAGMVILVIFVWSLIAHPGDPPLCYTRGCRYD